MMASDMTDAQRDLLIRSAPDWSCSPARGSLDYAVAEELEEMGYLKATTYDIRGPIAWKLTARCREEGIV